MPLSGRFVRFPTELLEALLQKDLSGAQWRIILWVVRQTYGWNRDFTPFTWYRIAQDIGMSRPAVYRAGQTLATVGILVVRERQVAIQDQTVANGQRLDRTLDVACKQRFSVELKTVVKTD